MSGGLAFASGFAFACLSVSTLFCQTSPHADAAEAILHDDSVLITAASGLVGVPPRVLASVVFAERSLNSRPAQALEEDVLARCGYNASLGLAQVKMRTASWIEAHLGEIDPSEEVARKLAPHVGRGELIDRLQAPETNLLYAAVYVALIVRRWAPVLDSQEVRACRTGIIATLYSNSSLIGRSMC